jgi:hypothetical protein
MGIDANYPVTDTDGIKTMPVITNWTFCANRALSY